MIFGAVEPRRTTGAPLDLRFFSASSGAGAAARARDSEAALSSAWRRWR